MKSFLLHLIAIAPILLVGACAKPGSFRVENRAPLVRVEKPVNPGIQEAPPPKPGDIVRTSGKIKFKNEILEGDKVDSGFFTLKGQIQLFNGKVEDIELTGHAIDGQIDLFPISGPLQNSLRARAYCFSEDKQCSHYFVDIFVKDEKGIFYQDQFSVEPTPPKIDFKDSNHPTTTTTVKTPPAPTSPEEVEEELNDDIDDGAGSGYVGTSDTEAKSLFLAEKPNASTPKPNNTPAAPKTENQTSSAGQAIRYCSSGRLENATNFKTLSNADDSFFNMFKDNSRFYGTTRLAKVIQDMGKFIQKETPGYKLQVGDVSSRNGGQLGKHKSHQNGTDADIAYLLTNKNAEFKKIVDNSGVTSEFLVKENWSLFKHAFKTGDVELILVDSKVKKAICQEAVAKGEIKSESEKNEAYKMISRLRIVSGHNNHFHLRIKCGDDNPRCQCSNGNPRCQDRSFPESGCF